MNLMNPLLHVEVLFLLLLFSPMLPLCHGSFKRKDSRFWDGKTALDEALEGEYLNLSSKSSPARPPTHAPPEPNLPPPIKPRRSNPNEEADAEEAEEARYQRRREEARRRRQTLLDQRHGQSCRALLILTTAPRHQQDDDYPPSPAQAPARRGRTSSHCAAP